MFFFAEKGGIQRIWVPVPTAPLMVPSSCKGCGQHWNEHGGGWEAVGDESAAGKSYLSETLAKGDEKFRWIFPS